MRRLTRQWRALVIGAVMALLAGCSNEGGQAAGKSSVGDAKQGAADIARIGCGVCHTIPGISGADGKVGPPLTDMGERVFIAGTLRNDPDNLVHWLRSPQDVVPGNAMPDMGLTDKEARNIAAYLYTLR